MMKPTSWVLTAPAHREVHQRRRQNWKRRRSSPDGLVADLQPALCQQILDIAVAQGEAQVQPNRVPDHIWREAVAGVGDCLHPREERRPTLSEVGRADV